MKEIVTKFGKVRMRPGDRFLWNTHKWYIVEFLDEENTVVRLDGTADVATLPQELVAELVEEYNYASYYWR